MFLVLVVNEPLRFRLAFRVYLPFLALAGIHALYVQWRLNERFSKIDEKLTKASEGWTGMKITLFQIVKISAWALLASLIVIVLVMGPDSPYHHCPFLTI